MNHHAESPLECNMQRPKPKSENNSDFSNWLILAGTVPNTCFLPDFCHLQCVWMSQIGIAFRLRELSFIVLLRMFSGTLSWDSLPSAISIILRYILAWIKWPSYAYREWHYWEVYRCWSGCGLVGESMSLMVGFETPHPQARPNGLQYK